jgi:RNA polymerase sigma factor (sigma-70 family)
MTLMIQEVADDCADHDSATGATLRNFHVHKGVARKTAIQRKPRSGNSRPCGAVRSRALDARSLVSTQHAEPTVASPLHIAVPEDSRVGAEAEPVESHDDRDVQLIAGVREGNIAAYGELYQRHVGAAHNLARQLACSSADADDLVSEAFGKVLDTLRGGRGPDSAFRAYLLTALRHTAYDKTRKDRKVELADDITTVVNPRLVSTPFNDTVMAREERILAARAFARLPERWQAVLWHTEIEGRSPADVAPELGLTPNGVSALAYRAREGLRQAYLQVHLAESSKQRCEPTVERLGAWTRGGLSKREARQVEEHLDECDSCQALSAELAEIDNSAFRKTHVHKARRGQLPLAMVAGGSKPNMQLAS